MQPHDEAASPLVVIATFVAGAVIVTALAYALFFDNPDPDIDLVQVDAAGRPAFEVTAQAGGLNWADLEVQFIDRAGSDLAPFFLKVPTGPVRAGDRLELEPTPAAGHYLLLIKHDGRELARLAVLL